MSLDDIELGGLNQKQYHLLNWWGWEEWIGLNLLDMS